MDSGNRPSWLAHLRDILILPFTVTCIVPYLLYDPHNLFMPSHLAMKVVGMLIGTAGLALFLYTVFLFRVIGHGTLAPWSEKQTLVVTGPYRFCRNPMISGVLFVLLGEALFTASLPILGWAVLFTFINTIYFMFAEEPALEKQFGSEYRRYKQHVSRWLPRWRPYTGMADKSYNVKPDRLL
jgi:protein-S-isoprenylcysteine O-methyltransferase Ste14